MPRGVYLDVLDLCPSYVVDDLHSPLEGQHLAKGLALHPTDSGRLQGGVEHGKIGHLLFVLPVSLVQWLVEHPEFVDVDGSSVIGVHGNRVIVLS